MAPLDLSSTYPAGRELLFRLLAGAMAVMSLKGVVGVCLERRVRRAGDRASDLAIAANITTYLREWRKKITS